MAGPINLRVFLAQQSSGGGEEADSHISLTDAVSIEAGDDIEELADNVLRLTSPVGTAGFSPASGLEGLHGACVWDLGSELRGGFSALVEFVSSATSHIICIGLLRSATQPSSTADLRSDSVWLQMSSNGSGVLNCHHSEETQGLQLFSTNTDNLSNPAFVSWQANGGPLSFEHRNHISWDTPGTTQKDRNDTTVVTANGNYYFFIVWGPGQAVSGSDKVVDVKIEAGFLP